MSTGPGTGDVATADPVVQRVLRMFEDWGCSYDAMCQSLIDNFAQDCVWENPGCPTSVGAQGAIDHVVSAARDASGLDTIAVRVDHVTHRDGLLWTERLDDLLRADGSLILSTMVAGVMQIDGDGRISAWREYSKRR